MFSDISDNVVMSLAPDTTVPLKGNFASVRKLWSSNKSPVMECWINLLLYNNNSENPLCIVMP